jgi:hypothetical protein
MGGSLARKIGCLTGRPAPIALAEAARFALTPEVPEKLKLGNILGVGIAQIATMAALSEKARNPHFQMVSGWLGRA